MNDTEKTLVMVYTIREKEKKAKIIHARKCMNKEYEWDDRIHISVISWYDSDYIYWFDISERSKRKKLICLQSLVDPIWSELWRFSYARRKISFERLEHTYIPNSFLLLELYSSFQYSPSTSLFIHLYWVLGSWYRLFNLLLSDWTFRKRWRTLS